MPTPPPHSASQGRRVAVVGATGAVGAEFLRLFDARNFPIAELRLLAGERSAGRRIDFRGAEHVVDVASEASFEGVDLAFFSAGAAASRRLAPAAVAAGALVVDNSSAFRMDPDVPLVVPEINGEAMRPEHRIVSVPNCSAIILLMAVHPLAALGSLERVIVSTYQSASGGGAAMMRRLLAETRAYLDGTAPEPAAASHPPYAFNLFSHNTAVGADGANEEEAKVAAESRKILGLPELRMNVTCVRVPVLRAHSESVTVEFSGPAPSLAEARGAWERAPGLRVVDSPETGEFPTPLAASGQDDVLVGRLRRDLSHPSALSFFVAGDQLLKGAALNAVQIAELALART